MRWSGGPAGSDGAIGSGTVMREWISFAAFVVAIVLALLVLLVLIRDRSRARAELAEARAETADLRARVDALASRVPSREEPYVITGVVSSGGMTAAPPTTTTPAPVPERIDGRLFADIVLRESVVKAASLTHGVRRAMSPESRNRIRFEFRQEVRRSRKQRKEMLRSARREVARRRAEEGVA